MPNPKVDLTGTMDKPIARSYEAEQALRDNLTGSVVMKKPIPATVPVDRIYIPKASLDAVKTDNSKLPSTPETEKNGADFPKYLDAVTLNKVKASNALLAETPRVEKGSPSAIDYDTRMTEIPSGGGA